MRPFYVIPAVAPANWNALKCQRRKASRRAKLNVRTPELAGEAASLAAKSGSGANHAAGLRDLEANRACLANCGYPEATSFPSA